MLNVQNIEVNQLQSDLLSLKNVDVSIIRLDKIHPVLSGNKLFKLYHFLEVCKNSSHKTILTFGGMYSNHLVATAYACQALNLNSIGVVRGEKPAVLSHSLNSCEAYGMQLKFISRSEYKLKDQSEFLDALSLEFGPVTIVPEGGYHPMGAKGASLILQYLNNDKYTHFASAVGTATTIAGLLLASSSHQHIIGVTALKNMDDIYKRISYLTENNFDPSRLTILNEYHFGGYAKYTSELISFMNEFHKQHSVATDFVYTSKMLYGIFDMIKRDQFPRGSNIACLHTGGLQGNLSLPPDTLLLS